MTHPPSQPPDKAGVVEDFLHELDVWESAYPLRAFPEPDLVQAAKVLKNAGMTLDAISASNMRHVVSRIAPKARAAIAALSSPPIMEEGLAGAAQRVIAWLDSAKAVPSAAIQYDMRDLAKAALAIPSSPEGM